MKTDCMKNHFSRVRMDGIWLTIVKSDTNTHEDLRGTNTDAERDVNKGSWNVDWNIRARKGTLINTF